MYTPPKNERIIKKKTKTNLQETKEFIKKISLIKFKEGGQAILIEQKINHQIDKEGNIDIRPLFKKILRVPERSYKTLAKKNRPDEQRPWATINIKEPITEEKE